MNVGDWIQFFLLLTAVGIFMLSGLGEILRVLREPRFKIVDSSIDRYQRGSDDEHKAVSFILKNTGGGVALDCKCDVKIKDVGQYSYFLSSVTFDLYPDDKRSQHICSISKNEGWLPLSVNHPTLNMGRVYTVEVRFYGRNFLDKKVHKFKLDLSSWEKVGIEIDC